MAGSQWAYQFILKKKKNQCSIHTLQQELTNVEMTHSHWIVSFMGMTTGMLVNVMLIFTNSDWRWEIILAVCEVTEYFQLPLFYLEAQKLLLAKTLIGMNGTAGNPQR